MAVLKSYSYTISAGDVSSEYLTCVANDGYLHEAFTTTFANPRYETLLIWIKLKINWVVRLPYEMQCGRLSITITNFPWLHVPFSTGVARFMDIPFTALANRMLS